MSKLTFEPYDDEGRPRVLAGMFRPPFESLTRSQLRSLLPSFAITSRFGEEREQWLAGGLDRPIYFDEQRPPNQGMVDVHDPALRNDPVFMREVHELVTAATRRIWTRRT